MTDIHVFERAGLGVAPFRIVGHEHKTFKATPDAPAQCGGSCDFCATAISDMFYICGADGKQFKVGSSCVMKTGDKGLINTVKREVNRLKRERSHARDDIRIAAARETFATPAVREVAASKPSPNAWRAEQGDTMADHIEWMLKNAGRSGKVCMARIIEKMAAV